jgi:hypothetical protein
MKLLKAVGKVLSLPFDLVLILGKLLLIPIKLVSVLLHGEFIEWNKKRKFIGNSIKEMFKAFKYNKDYSFLYSVGFTDENGNFYERIETFKITKDSVQNYIDYAKASLKQESA